MDLPDAPTHKIIIWPDAPRHPIVVLPSPPRHAPRIAASRRPGTLARRGSELFFSTGERWLFLSVPAHRLTRRQLDSLARFLSNCDDREFLRRNRGACLLANSRWKEAARFRK